MLVIYAQELKKKHQLKSNQKHCFVSIFYAFPAALFDKKIDNPFQPTPYFTDDSMRYHFQSHHQFATIKYGLWESRARSVGFNGIAPISQPRKVGVPDVQ